ncbi:threonine dehydratase [Mastigocoleus sp. MO_188.B34]|uniref:threonine dehydratase n=1 Tax=Mastigocoleus sp. MO_188.B34 TaxID=3036635 RepID=UPI00263404BA|nr:threonine dehydratase [Mastigocoleus sp. MO_188.B34]MDJ0694737.1 threonine dehydratase [Mastigocoleus sp. MO_188.B34]
MSRLNQTFQNFFIRLGSFLSVLFRGISGFFGKRFSSIGKLFGFSSETKYFVESEQSQDVKPTIDTTSSVKDLTNTVNTARSSFNNRKPRRTDMDYFMDMAQKVNKN